MVWDNSEDRRGVEHLFIVSLQVFIDRSAASINSALGASHWLIITVAAGKYGLHYGHIYAELSNFWGAQNDSCVNQWYFHSQQYVQVGPLGSMYYPGP